MKVLILSCNTGGGHNTAAKAIKEVFDEQNIEVEIKDALSFGGQLASDLVCDSYIEMVKKTPKLFGEIYKMGNKLGAYNAASEKIRSPVYLINKLYTDDLEEYILDNKFTVVICTHIFPAEAMSHLKKRHNLQAKFYFVATDYYCCPMCEEILPDAIFVPHKDSIFTYTNKGISSKKLIPTGIPVSQKFVNVMDKMEARSKVGLKEDDKAFLLMSGSMGFGDIIKTAHSILDNGDEHWKVVAITGNNKDLYNSFEKEFKEDSRLILLGFTDMVSVYMSACDILLSKPGGLSSTEAFVAGIPIIHTSPIPGCETENTQFFAEHHLSLVAQDSVEAGRLAVKLMNDDFLRNQIIAAQKQYRPKNAAKDIVEYIKRNK